MIAGSAPARGGLQRAGLRRDGERPLGEPLGNLCIGPTASTVWAKSVNRRRGGCYGDGCSGKGSTPPTRDDVRS